MELRQSTSQVIRFGPFLDSTDGVTPETALTITQADMQLSKDGAAFAQKNASGNATHDVDGFYTTTLNTTDSNTTAILKLQVTVSGALPVWDNFDVVTQSYYDAKYTGTFNNLGGVAQSADNDTKITIIDTEVDKIVTAVITNAAGIDISDDISNVPTNAEFNARTLVAASYFDPVNDAVANVTLVATTTTNTDMVSEPLTAAGTRSALGLATANMDVQFAASVTATGFNVGKTGYALTQSFPSNFASLVISATGDVNSDINKINGVTIVGDGSANPFDV